MRTGFAEQYKEVAGNLMKAEASARMAGANSAPNDCRWSNRRACPIHRNGQIGRY